VKVDYRCVQGGDRSDFFIVTDRDNSVAAHGQRLRLRPCVILSPDLAIYEDSIGMLS
jgi:hypothetical protein